MRFHFTKHARGKFLRVQKAGFKITQKQVKQTIISPLKVEDRSDNTHIATTLIDKTHVLRVEMMRNIADTPISNYIKEKSDEKR